MPICVINLTFLRFSASPSLKMARSGGLLTVAAAAAVVVKLSASISAHADTPCMAPPSVGRADGTRVNSGDTSGMVPITRDFLRAFYARFDSPCLSSKTSVLRARALAAAAALGANGEAGQTPRRLDECMYAARCACEEATVSLRSSDEHAIESAAGHLDAARMRFLDFQQAQQEKASRMVAGFLPTDFRGRLFHAAREKGEQRNRTAVVELVSRGGSIADKYALLWEQQWGRRETLSMVGNATGIWRLVVRYLAGVPQPLLDFARAINKPDGPTEELRLKFGPVLNELVLFARELSSLAEAMERARNNGRGNSEAVVVIEEAAEGFREEVDRFCELLTEVVEKSPFFVSNEEIEAMKMGKGELNGSENETES